MQPYHDKLYRLVEQRPSQDFNCINVDVVEAYLEKNGTSVCENIRCTDYMRARMYISEVNIDRAEFFEWLKQKYALADRVEYSSLYPRLLAEDIGQSIGLESEYRDAIITYINAECFNDADDLLKESFYPGWCTLLECNGGWMEEAALEKVDQLYDIGIGVIEGCENLNAMLFIPSAGYDFVEKHFMKMYPKVFEMFVAEADMAEAEHEQLTGVTL